MRILIKIGGAQLEHPDARSDLARSVAAATADGHQVIVVHGGGNQIRSLSKDLGIEDHYHEGLRNTDAATAEVALMVLGGSVNRTLVAALQQAGVSACGLTGADGASFSARPHRPKGADLGYVGQVDTVAPQLIETLLAAGTVPVLASVAPLAPGRSGPRDRFYNINADHLVGPLARALACQAVLFLTDVPGVLDRTGALQRDLDPSACDRLRQEGVLKSGMLPKVEAALTVCAVCPDATVKIAPAGVSDAVRQALTQDGGTSFALSASCP